MNIIPITDHAKLDKANANAVTLLWFTFFAININTATAINMIPNIPGKAKSKNRLLNSYIDHITDVFFINEIPYTNGVKIIAHQSKSDTYFATIMSQIALNLFNNNHHLFISNE